MRVVLVGPTAPHRGGIVHYTHSLAAGLADAGVDTTLLSYRRLFPALLHRKGGAGGDRTAPGTSRAGAPVVEQGPQALDARVASQLLLTWHPPYGARAAGPALDAADVVHVQSWTGFLGPSMLAAVRRARRSTRAHPHGARIVVTLHNVAPHEASHRVLGPLTKALLRRADRVIVHTQALAGLAQRTYGLAPGRVAVLRHGTYAFAHSGLGREAARDELGIPQGAKVLLCLGTIRDYKGIDVAMETLARLPADHHLLVAGEPWEPWQRYDELAARLGIRDRVHAHLGYVPDERVEVFYRAADLTFLPYRHFQGQSGQALAAAGFGLPIVAARVGGLADIIAEDALAAPGDVDAFVARVQECLRRGKPTLRPGAAPTWSEVAADTVRLYGELLQEAA